MFNSLWLIHIYHASGESRTFYADGEYINDIIIKVWLYLYFLSILSFLSNDLTSNTYGIVLIDRILKYRNRLTIIIQPKYTLIKNISDRLLISVDTLNDNNKIHT